MESSTSSAANPSREKLTRLHIFGRPTKLATDDVSGPATCIGFLRIIWLLVLVIAYVRVVYQLDGTTLIVQDCEQTYNPLLITFNNETNNDDQIYASNIFENESTAYTATSITLLSAVIVCVLITRGLGRRGSILEYEKRAAVPVYFHAFIGLVSLEVGLAVYGTLLVQMFDDSTDLESGALGVLGCEAYDEVQGLDSMAGIIYANIVMLWIDLAIFIVWLLLILRGLNFFSCRHRRGGALASDDPLAQFDNKAVAWERRLKSVFRGLEVVTCGLFGVPTRGQNADEAFSSMAQVFTHWFTGTSFVPSELVTAFILMRAEQYDQEQERLDDLEAASPREQAAIAAGLLPLNSLPVASSTPASPRSPRRSLRAVSSALASTRQVRVSTKSQHVTGAMFAVNSVFSLNELEDATSPEAEGGDAILKQVQEGSFDQLPSPKVTSTDRTHMLNQDAYDLLDEAKTYAPFMLAIMGWTLTWISNPLSSCCNLWGHTASKHTRPAHKQRTAWKGEIAHAEDAYHHEVMQAENTHHRAASFEGEGCCATYRSAFLAQGIRMEHVLFADVVTQAGENVPFAVIADPATKSIVITCRSTMTLPDFVTDATLMPEELTEAGKQWGFDGVGHYAHGGMLRTAMKIREELETDGTLQVALSGELVVAGESCEGFTVVIVGNSLGGGVAAILSLLLRHAYPTLRCLVYSPPGCIFSLEMAERSADWIKTVFLGKDMVARLSWQNLVALRKELMELVCRCKVSKGTVFHSMRNRKPASSMLHDRDEIPDTPHTRQLLHLIDELERRNSVATTVPIMERMPLFIPGKVLHLVKYESIKSKVGTCGPGRTRVKRNYIPMWVHDRTKLDEIKVSNRMLFDHLVFHLMDVVERICDQHKDYQDVNNKQL